MQGKGDKERKPKPPTKHPRDDTSTPPARFPPPGSPGPRPTDVVDLIENLKSLSVDANRSPLPPKAIGYIANPVKKPNACEKTIWFHVLRKCEALSHRRLLPPLTNKQKEDLNTAVRDLPTLHSSIQNLSREFQLKYGDEETTIQGAYLEGLHDASQAAYCAYDYERFTVGRVREYARMLRQAFDGNAAQIGDGSENHQGMTVRLSDFETIIRDERNNGWLNQIALMAAILAVARANPQNPTFVVHSDVLARYRHGDIPPTDLLMPDTAQNLVFPFFFTNHWTVGLVDVTARTITHLDSTPNIHNRHQDAIRTMQNVLAANQHIYGGEWAVSTTRSPRQVNSDDCAIWVYEHASAMIERREAPVRVTPATRRFLAESLYTALIRDTPPRTAQSQREQAAAAVVRMNATAPGTRIQPIDAELLRGLTPGPDMPPLQTRLRSPSELSDARSDITDPFMNQSGGQSSNQGSGQSGRGSGQSGRGSGQSGRGSGQSGRGSGQSGSRSGLRSEKNAS
jgi:uncharacterized membrane protein YgcG